MIVLILAFAVQAAYARIPGVQLRSSRPDLTGPYVEVRVGKSSAGADARVKHWPSASQLASFYPAAMRGIGYVELSCDVPTSGRLKNCRVTEQAPLTKPLAAPALRLASLLRFDPQSAKVARIIVTFNSGYYEAGDPCMPPVCYPTPPPSGPTRP